MATTQNHFLMKFSRSINGDDGGGGGRSMRPQAESGRG